MTGYIDLYTGEVLGVYQEGISIREKDKEKILDFINANILVSNMKLMKMDS